MIRVSIYTYLFLISLDGSRQLKWMMQQEMPSLPIVRALELVSGLSKCAGFELTWPEAWKYIHWSTR